MHSSRSASAPDRHVVRSPAMAPSPRGWRSCWRSCAARHPSTHRIPTGRTEVRRPVGRPVRIADESSRLATTGARSRAGRTRRRLSARHPGPRGARRHPIRSRRPPDSDHLHGQPCSPGARRLAARHRSADPGQPCGRPVRRLEQLGAVRLLARAQHRSLHRTLERSHQESGPGHRYDARPGHAIHQRTTGRRSARQRHPAYTRRLRPHQRSRPQPLR